MRFYKTLEDYYNSELSEIWGEALLEVETVFGITLPETVKSENSFLYNKQEIELFADGSIGEYWLSCGILYSQHLQYLVSYIHKQFLTYLKNKCYLIDFEECLDCEDK